MLDSSADLRASTLQAMTNGSAEAAEPTTDLDALLQNAVDEAKRLLDVDAAVIYLLEHSECSYRAYDCGLPEDARAEARAEQIVPGHGMSGLAIALGESMITSDYLNDDRFWDPSERRRKAGLLRATSVVAVPMKGHEGSLGAFCVFDRRHRTFSPFELALVTGLAGHAAFALENARLNRRLLATRAQAAELAAGRERAHLAQELHDSVTQALFSMTLTARSAEILLERNPAAVREKLAELRELSQEALAEMRSLIFELRPGNVAEEGLASALAKHVAAVQGRTGLPVTLDVRYPARLPLELEETLYRIAQEALHNVVKHAAAGHVRVEVSIQGGVAGLTVEDDGVGFDPGAVETDHLGLAGMRTRLERLGGRLVVISRQGKGTRLLATIPMPGSPEENGSAS